MLEMIKNKKLIIIGNTSNAKLAHFYFNSDSEYNIVGFSVNTEYISSPKFCDLPVFPLENLSKSHPKEDFYLFVSIGYSNMNNTRKRIYLECKNMGYSMANYISSSCNFLTDREIGDNNFILEDNTIQPFVEIGSNNVIWSGNHIGHDVKIMNHCFITSHVVISGFTIIKNNCFIGVNSTLRDDILIAPYSLIGAGVTIMDSTNENDVYLAPKPFKLDKLSTDLKIS